MLADQRIVLAGSYRTSTAVGDGFPVEDFFAMRLLPNGLPDPTFGSQMGDMEGTVVFDFGPLEPTKSPGYAAALRVDGERVVLAGFAVKPAEGTQQSNNLEFAIARLDHGLDQTFDVSFDSAGNGTLSPTLQQNVKHSDHVDFDVHPAPGYGLDTIEGCGGALYGKVYTTGPIVADCMVTATFELKPVPLFSDQFEQ